MEPLRVLVVSDDPEVREEISRALARAFAAVDLESIADAEHWARAMARGDFHLVITDRRTHWGDALAILKAVKARWPERPVILFAAPREDALLTRAMEAGADACVLWAPGRLHGLAEVVREALGQAGDVRRAEAEYRELFQSVPVGLYRTTPEGRFLDANPALVAMLGYPDRDALLEANLNELCLDASTRARRQELLAREGVIRHFEMRIRRRDGSVIWVEDNARARRDAQGVVRYQQGSLQDITRRKEAEAALRASEERFRTIFEGAAIGIALVDTAGRPVQSNPALQRMLGYTEQELRRMAFVEFTHPADRALDWALFRELFAGKRDHYQMEKRYIRKDGRIIWGRLTVSRPRGEERSYVIGMVEDITERKRAEEALRESQQQLQAIMDNAPAVIFVRDVQGRYQMVNRGYEERFHVDREELLGKTPYDLFPKEVADELLAHDRQVLEQGEPIQFEEVVPVEGELRTYIAVKFPLRDHTGKPYAVCSISTDITDRKRAEQALAEAKSRLQAVISNAPIVLWALDEGGRFTLYEGKGSAALGLDPEMVIGRGLAEVYEDVPAFLRLNQEALAGREATGVVEMKGRVLEVRCSPLRDPQERVIGVIGVATDVTEQRRAEAEVRRRAAHLEALNTIIAAATAAMELEQLLQVALEHTLRALELEKGVIWIRERRLFHGLSQEEGMAITQGIQRAGGRVSAPLVVADWAQEDGPPMEGVDVGLCASSMLRYGLRASLTVPILAEGENIGGLCVIASQPRAWSPEDIALVEAVGRQLGTAAERLRLLEETRRRLREVTLLSRVIALTAAARDLPAALQEICAELARFFGVPQAAFALLNPERTEARVVAEYLEPGRPPSMGEVIPVQGNPSMTYLLEKREPLAVADVQRSRLLAPVREILQRRGTVSLLLIPIEVGDQVIGTLGLDAIEPREWHRDDIQLVRNIARQVGQMLERLRIFSDLQERVHLMDRLQPLSESLSRPLSIEEVATAVGQGALALSGADRAAVYLREAEDRFSCPWSHGLSAHYIQQILAHVDRIPGGRLRTDPDPILIPDMETLPEDHYQWLLELAREEGYRGLALWPLVYEGRMVATVGCYYDAPRAWSQAEREVMMAFARQAAIALENARLYESLRQMNEELQAAVRARDEMIQNVSHELRTPLALIKGYVELLDSGALGALSDQQTEAVTVMYRQSERLLYMVNRLLTLQRLTAEVLQKAFTQIEILLRETATTWEPRAKEAGIELRLELADALPPLMVDPELIGQVIANLLDNAIKFSPNGGVITIRAYPHDGEVVIAISDQGIGIPPEKLEQVFERFYQVEGHATRRFSGMGIGLALCRKIVELHGGRIWAESAGEGQGSTFYVALPALEME